MHRFFKSKFKKNQDIVHAHNIPAALAMKNSQGKKILSLHGIFSQQIDQLHGKKTANISKKFEKGMRANAKKLISFYKGILWVFTSDTLPTEDNAW